MVHRRVTVDELVGTIFLEDLYEVHVFSSNLGRSRLPLDSVSRSDLLFGDCRRERIGSSIGGEASNSLEFTRNHLQLLSRSSGEECVAPVVDVKDVRNKNRAVSACQLQGPEHDSGIRDCAGVAPIDFPEVIVAHLLDEARAEGLEVGGVPLFAPRIVPDRRREPQASVDGKLPVGDPGPLAMCVQDALQSMRGQLVVAIEPHDDLVVG